jgi:signal transduction histidine kinase
MEARAPRDPGAAGFQGFGHGLCLRRWWGNPLRAEGYGAVRNDPGPRVLVVDDEPSLAAAIVTTMTGQGYTAVAAGSSVEALSRLDRDDFELVFVDLALERRAGGELLSALRRLPARTVAVVLTGSAADVSLADAFREGAFDFLTTPLDAATLRAVAARAIEHAVLGRTTRELVEELDDANTRLRALNAELEERVERATDELRRKVEELSRAKGTLEVAQRQREQFIQTVAHDLGAPLSALQGYAALLGQNGVPPEMQARARGVITAEVRRLARLVGDLASAEHAAADRFGMTPGPCDLVGIVREQVELASVLSGAHAFRFAAPDGPVAATWDRDRVAQVVSNLVTNAIKHTPGGAVRVRVWSEGGEARLSVSDDGPGIPPELRRRLFGRGARGADIGKSVGGAGLGLHIARMIIEAHDGRIWVDEGGPGATFCVALPLAPRREGPAADQAALAAPAGAKL